MSLRTKNIFEVKEYINELIDQLYKSTEVYLVNITEEKINGKIGNVNIVLKKEE